jgi:uncharacterized membrane protein
MNIARELLASGLLFIILGIIAGFLTPITTLGYLLPYPPYAWPATVMFTFGLLLSLVAIYFIENMKNRKLFAVGFSFIIIGLIVAFQNPVMGLIRNFAEVKLIKQGQY